MNSASIKFWVKFVIGINLISALIYSLDWRAFLAVLTGVSYQWLFAALFVPVMGVAVSTWKWRLFLRLLTIPEKYSRLFIYYWIGYFLNNFFPAGTGGDIGRLALLRRSGKLREVAASIFMERITGVITLCAVSFAGVIVLGRVDLPEFVSFWIPPALFVLSGVSISFFLLMWFSETLYRYLEQRGNAWGSQGTVQRGNLREFLLVLLWYFRQSGTMWKSLGISVLFYVLIVILHFFILIALGVDFPLWAPVVIAAAINLISVVPVSPNGLGVNEWSFVFFYSLVGISPAEAMAAAVLARMIGSLASVPGGILWLQLKNQSAAAVKHESYL